MNLRRTLAGTALAATLACGPLATGAVAQSGPATAPTTTAATTTATAHTTVATPHPGPDASARPKKGDRTVPVLPSAPLDGLPTLREAQERGLLAGPVTAPGEATTQDFPGPGCSTPPQGWSYHDYLNPGECLTSDTYIAVNVMFNRWYELWVQADGNLVFYDHNESPYKALWQTGTQGNWKTSLWMQWDGNVVLYDGWGNPLWNTGTNGCGGLGAWLRVQKDANIVLYARDWSPIWARFDGPGSRPC
ncbi:hypothetical protein ABZ990_04175 [Streptomyces sp. NPDC046203]|uniref:hypothetical protein n=1 Tax=Streptomyces sp. NPDC046203 TaxID=3154602 RepID=UPI0033EF26B3